MPSRAVWLAGVAALMPLIAGPLQAAPAAARATTPFAAPDTEMLLTRTVRRPLPGGAEVLARRSYAIRFTREGAGYRIDGRLAQVEVDAPPPLRALAALERQRRDEGMFPMWLDAEGRLLTGSGPRRAEQVGQAIDAAATAPALDTIGTLDKLQAQAFIRQLGENPVRSPWPEELFRPVPGNRRETRMIPLVNGGRGRVVTDIAARATVETGLLVSFDRTVTSDLEGDTRATYESWTLVPL